MLSHHSSQNLLTTWRTYRILVSQNDVLEEPWRCPEGARDTGTVLYQSGGPILSDDMEFYISTIKCVKFLITLPLIYFRMPVRQ